MSADQEAVLKAAKRVDDLVKRYLEPLGPDATIHNLTSPQRAEAFDVIDDARFIQERTGVDLGLQGRSLDLMRYSMGPDVLGPEAFERESHVRRLAQRRDLLLRPRDRGSYWIVDPDTNAFLASEFAMTLDEVEAWLTESDE